MNDVDRSMSAAKSETSVVRGGSKSLVAQALWLGVLVAALVMPGCMAPDANSQNDEPSWVQELSAQYLDAQRAATRAAAERVAIDGQVKTLDKFPAARPDEPGAGQPGEVPEFDAVGEMLRTSVHELTESLESDAGRVGQGIESDSSEWSEVARARFRLKWQLDRASDDAVLVARYTSLLSARSKHFWLWSTVGITSLLVIVVHNRRHEFRRVFNGGRAKTWAVRTWKYVLALGILLGIVSLLLFFMGERIEDWIWKVATGISPRDLALTVVDDAEQERSRTEAPRNASQEKWVLRLKQLQGRIPEGWLTALENRRRLVVALAIRERLAARFADEQATLAGLHNQLESKLSNMTEIRVERRKGRLILGVVLLSAVVTGHLLFWIGVFRRRLRTGRTCPQCMAVGRFAKVPPTSPGSPVNWECQEIITHKTTAVSNSCAFRVLDTHRERVKLSFPTLGIPLSGKTHWMAMAFNKIALGDFPINVRLDPIDSPSADRFHRIVSEILRSRINPSPTQTNKIPEPLVFEFRDDDSWGSSEVLLNMFDFSGEVMDRTLDDPHLVRALQADGYMFFLDPTKPPEEQVRTLSRFHDHVSTIIGRSLRTPVALCVSKIDLLEKQPYGEGDNIRRFYSALQEIGDAVTLDAMRQRSEITRDLRDAIWPGWNIEREVNEIFGGRHQFFPMTPVGLENRGEAGLGNVAIPFAILEPLLWLLHMTGHPIFTK